MSEAIDLLEGPNFAHLATLGPDGEPHSVPVWAAMEGDRVVFFTQPSSQKAKNVERDARVAISVVDFEQPYRGGWVRGRVVATREGEAALEVMDRMAQQYTGEPFPMRSGVLYEVEVEKEGFMALPFRHDPS